MCPHAAAWLRRRRPRCQAFSFFCAFFAP
jgi:hypothetical protein